MTAISDRAKQDEASRRRVEVEEGGAMARTVSSRAPVSQQQHSFSNVSTGLSSMDGVTALLDTSSHGGGVTMTRGGGASAVIAPARAAGQPV